MFSRITKGVINAHFPTLPSEFPIKQVWEVLRNPPFLTSSPVGLMQVVQAYALRTIQTGLGEES